MTNPRERIARTLFVEKWGPWVSGQGITPGGTPWGTSGEAALHDEYLTLADAVLSALTSDEAVREWAGVLEAAWAKAEPEHPVTHYPASYRATFADMAGALRAHLTDGAL